jgi:hypothetical protein
MHARQKMIKIQKAEPTIESGNSRVVVFGKNHEQLFHNALTWAGGNIYTGLKKWVALLNKMATQE